MGYPACSEFSVATGILADVCMFMMLLRTWRALFKCQYCPSPSGVETALFCISKTLPDDVDSMAFNVFPSLRPWFLWNRYMSSPTWTPFPFTSKCDLIATICEERPLGNLPSEAKVPKECHIVIVPHGGTEGFNTLWSLFLIKSYEDYCSLSWDTDYILHRWRMRNICKIFLVAFCSVYLHRQIRETTCNFGSQIRQKEILVHFPLASSISVTVKSVRTASPLAGNIPVASSRAWIKAGAESSCHPPTSPSLGEIAARVLLPNIVFSLLYL